MQKPDVKSRICQRNGYSIQFDICYHGLNRKIWCCERFIFEMSIKSHQLWDWKGTCGVIRAFLYRSGGGPGILYRGKQIEVDIALTQEDARSMASSGNYGSLPASKRNLYLVDSPFLTSVVPFAQPRFKEIIWASGIWVQRVCLSGSIFLKNIKRGT